jgi:hypothetical protein
MRLIPRAEEVAEVVELLERDDYDSAEALAKDIIKLVADIFWFRTWYVLVIRGRQSAFGPFASEAEAASLGKKYEGILVPSDPESWGVGTVYGLGGTAEERAGGGFGYCSTVGCGHPAYMHSMVGPSRGKCVLSECACKEYEQVKRKPRVTRAKKATS